MILIASGVLSIGMAGGVLWYFKPRDGKTHRLATAPIFESMIPITITAGVAVGVAMIVSGATQ